MEQHKTNRIRELLAASNDIYSKLHQYKDDLKDIHNSSNIDHNDIIDFADNITLTLSAPRLYRDGLPLIASHAPCPQFYEMRMGRLATFNSSSTVKQIQDIGNNKEELSIERKISIMQEKQERQLSSTSNSNNNSNKRKRSDDIDLNEEKVDDRPVRRFKEDTIVAKAEVNVTNGTKSSTTIVSSSSTTATITKINNNSDISKAESKSNENNDTTKVIKTEASSVSNAPIQAPKRVINISFGLSDSDSD